MIKVGCPVAIFQFGLLQAVKLCSAGLDPRVVVAGGRSYQVAPGGMRGHAVVRSESGVRPCRSGWSIEPATDDHRRALARRRRLESIREDLELLSDGEIDKVYSMVAARVRAANGGNLRPKRG